MMDNELSRRRWLWQLGGATFALAGLSGAEFDNAAASQLPPGLYGPSTDHLAHILSANKPPAPSAAPLYFSASDFSHIQQLTALILGEQVSAPVVAEIASWIDLIVDQSEAVKKAVLALPAPQRKLATLFYGENAVHEVETRNPRTLCQTGFDRLGPGFFSNLSQPDQLAELEKMEAQHDAFLAWFKARVIDGFYTSHDGLKELDYKGNAFYARCPGCGNSDS